MFNMFAYAAVDAVQESKKKFVESTVQHEGIKKALDQFVDAQTKYTKSAVDAGMSTMSSLGMIFMSKEFFDYVQNQAKAVIPTYTQFTPAKAASKKA
jgi:Fe-S cluster assembly scaffold protein SufB